jgi:tetratricopeptide (TPR) repeat protein
MMAQDKADKSSGFLPIGKADTAEITKIIEISGRFNLTNPDELDSSLYYLNQALGLAREAGSREHLFTIYEQYSKTLTKSANYALALDYYFKILTLLDEDLAGQNDSLSVYRRYVSIYVQIGICYFNMDNFKSLEYFRKSLDAIRKLKQIDPDYPAREREMMIYINIGSAYMNNYDFKEAEINFKRVLELNESLNNTVLESSLYNNLGIVYKEKKDFDTAFMYYEKSLRLRSELKDSAGMAQTYNNLGDAYYLTGNYVAAIEALDKALWLSRETGNLRSEMKAANFLSIAYEKTGNYPRAFEMYRIYTTLHDSIKSMDNVQNSIRLEMQ